MRYILLDRITGLHPPEVATGLKAVSLSDDIFNDHFPGHPVMPGALIIESLAQLGGVLLEASMRLRDRFDLHALLVGVERAKFRRMVRPGDQLQLEARVGRVNEDGGQIKAIARLEEKVAAEAELSFAFAHITNPDLLARRREVLNIWLHGAASPLHD